MNEEYDSTQDILNHIKAVQNLLYNVFINLGQRSKIHDQFKLDSLEKEIFDDVKNPHDPEFYSNGIQGMSLLDLIEMICDWRAMTSRYKDGDILKSIEVNQKRFNYSDELKQILLNTVKELNF